MMSPKERGEGYSFYDTSILVTWNIALVGEWQKMRGQKKPKFE